MAEIGRKIKKGDRTKRRISEAAQRLFATKGFAKVTMQDICNEANISRGGLYRHFDSTTEIFIFLIKSEYENHSEAFDLAREKGFGAETIFNGFLDARFNYLLDRELNFDGAFKEFALTQNEGMELMREYIENSIVTLASILEMGAAQKIFTFSDARDAAKHIHWVLLGMGIHNAIVPLSSEEIEKQKREIYNYLGYKTI